MAELLRPPVSSVLEPETFRFISKASGPRLAIVGVAILLALAIGAEVGGVAIRGRGASLLGGYGLMAAGVGFGLLALSMAFLGVLSTRSSLKNFREGPLIPGVVVSMKPKVVVALTDMGEKAFPGASYGLGQKTVGTLGVDGAEVGTRVVCFTRPLAELEADSIHDIEFDLLGWGTSDPSAHSRCLELLGEEPFRVLEACIRRGPVPSADTEKILLDRSLEHFGKFGRPGETPSG